jgi:hypothetical protein
VLRANALALVLAASSCGTPTGPRPVEPGQPFEVKVGETVAVAGITLRFDSVTDDSRCPVNANCIWEGDARVNVHVEGAGEPRAVALHTNRSVGGDVDVDALRLSLEGLRPYPVLERAIDPKSYVATLRATRR